MKRRNVLPFLKISLAAFIASQVLTVMQASAAGYKLADRTGASIAEFKAEIVDVKKEVDASMAALGKILTDASQDPRSAYKGFAKSVPRVEAAARKAKKRAEDMQASGRKYFDQWEKEITQVSNPEVQRLAQERKAKLQNTFDSIRVLMEPSRDQFNTWVTDIKDLQKYLGNDLTVAGIDAAKELIDRSISEGQVVQKTLDRVISELNAIVAALTPAKAPAKKN
jgi:hypothetical protein